MNLFDQDDPDAPPAEPPAAAAPSGGGQASDPPPEEAAPPKRRLPRLPADETYVEVRRPPGALRKLIGVLVVFALVAGLALGGAYWWYRRQVDPPGPPGAAVSVIIKKGTSTNGIGGTLEHAGVVANKTVFAFYVRRKKAGPFEAGRFVLRKNSDLDLVIRNLEHGPIPPALTRVNIPEGLTVAELTAKLHDAVARFRPAEVRQVLASGQVPSSLHPGAKGSWEGLLYPATYDVGAHTEAVTVLSDMAKKMEQVTEQNGIGMRAAAIGQAYGFTLTPYKALIVASLIQREAGSAQEAPKIATVIYNRLRRGIPLGIDATSRYVAELTGKKIDFKSRSVYNTRRRKGLPPTPIAAPGQFAIHAALNPARGRWIYYVLTSPRKHTFAVTDAQFLAAKEICKAKALGCG